MSITELTEIDVKILQYINIHGSSSVAELEKVFPDIVSIQYRLEKMATPMTVHSVPISNSSFLLQDYKDVKCGLQEPLGIYRLTDMGQKALQDYQCAKSTHKRELWLKNAWIPIIVAFATTVLTNYILPKLPLLIKWCLHMFSKIFSCPHLLSGPACSGGALCAALLGVRRCAGPLLVGLASLPVPW